MSISELLSNPLAPDWTIEELAEQLLASIAAQQPQSTTGVQEFVLSADAVIDQQSRRLLRPLLACLANKSASEAGASTNVFAGRLCFKRPGPMGPVCITGEFDNRAGSVRVVFQRSDREPFAGKNVAPKIGTQDSTLEAPRQPQAQK